jgi:hypothetical protein
MCGAAKVLRPGEVVKVAVSASNYAKKTTANVSLELVVEGDRKAEQVLEIAPGASQTVAFPLSLAKPGRIHGRASKNHDRLPVDDDRFFLIEVSNSIPVAILWRKTTPQRSRRGRGRGCRRRSTVEKALNPRGIADGEFIVPRLRSAT